MRRNNCIPGLTLLFIIILSGNEYIYAERDNILLNVHIGYHYDVGNLRSENGAGINPQHSMVIGASYKADLSFFFLQLGINKSVLLARGTISDNSADELKSVTINYYSAPMYCGINFPIKDNAKMFMGAGIVYFLLDGNVGTDSGSESFSEIAFGRAITLGFQYRFLEQAGLFMQWEYISLNTAPVADTDNTNNWQNYEIDLTGDRMIVGITYYIK